MRYFTSFPKNNNPELPETLRPEWTKTLCPVCNSDEDGECALIPVDDTNVGHNCEASVVHKKCMEKAMEGFRHNKAADILYYSLSLQE